MKGIVFSLFDGSGLAVADWAKAGYQCYCFNADNGDHGAYNVKVKHPNIHYINQWIDNDFDPSIYGVPDIIFAFPDCTNLAGSGAKTDRTDIDVNVAINNAKIVEKIANKYGCPYYIENPVGKMSTLFRKPDYYFHPYEYGGYLDVSEDSFHPRMPRLDAYTKKTCIFSGNGFKMPQKKPVPHIGKFWGWAYLGGKSSKTKQLRSLTPRGFARAVFEANKNIN